MPREDAHTKQATPESRRYSSTRYATMPVGDNQRTLYASRYACASAQAIAFCRARVGVVTGEGQRGASRMMTLSHRLSSARGRAGIA